MDSQCTSKNIVKDDQLHKQHDPGTEKVFIITNNTCKNNEKETNGIDKTNTVLKVDDEDQEKKRSKMQRRYEHFVDKNWDKFLIALKALLFVGYFVYFGFAVAHHIGDEGSWRLIGCTLLAVCLMIWRLFKRSKLYNYWNSAMNAVGDSYSEGKRSTVVRWWEYVCYNIIIIHAQL